VPCVTMHGDKVDLFVCRRGWRAASVLSNVTMVTGERLQACTPRAGSQPHLAFLGGSDCSSRQRGRGEAVNVSARHEPQPLRPRGREPAAG
jgi:hypothetical protein